MTHQHWPDIEAFHNVRKYVQKYEPDLNEISYKPKIKLHGTNAAVQIRNRKIFAQSRSSYVTPENDNMGFAKWVEENREYFENLSDSNDVITIFGEWCGSGIQKGTAINQIGEKIFCVFAVQYGDFIDETYNDIVKIEVDTFKINEFLQGPRLNMISLMSNIYSKPWMALEGVVVNFKDDNSLLKSVEYISELVEEVEKCDPFVKLLYDIEGLGEGLVFYPIINNESIMTRKCLKSYTFKAKGEKHKTVKTKNKVQISPEVMESIEEFADKTVTEARLEQAVREISKGEFKFEDKLIGPFIGWIGKDVKKETQAELEASDLTWKQVQKCVTTKARDWYLNKLKEI